MSLQPEADTEVDRTATAPFLLRLFWRQSRPLEPYEFSIAPPADRTGISDYSSLLPSSIRQQSVQIYTWPTCTLAELTGLLASVLPANVLPSPAVGTQLVYKLIFPDTRASTSASGKGKWIDKPFGSVVIGGRGEGAEEENAQGISVNDLGGDALKTLAEARFVIGDYIACCIYPPGPDGRVVPPPITRAPRDGPRGPRDGGYGRSGGDRGDYRGGYGGAPPPGDWRRGERPPAPGESYRRGGGGYGRWSARPY